MLDRADPTVVDQPLGRQRRESREPQLGHRLGADLIGAEIGGPVGPPRRPTGAEKHDHIHQLPPVQHLPCHKIVGRDLVGGIGRTLLRDIDDDRLADQMPQGNRVGGLAGGGKMPWGIEVGATVFGRGKPVGGVVIALRGRAVHALLEPKPLLGGPVDRLVVEWMREINPASLRPFPSLRSRRQFQDDRGRGLPGGCPAGQTREDHTR
jgi:hypothetical protein